MWIFSITRINAVQGRPQDVELGVLVEAHAELAKVVRPKTPEVLLDADQYERLAGRGPARARDSFPFATALARYRELYDRALP